MDRYRRAVDAAQEIIWAHRDLHFVFVNSFAAAFVGQASPEAMIGLPMIEFFHPDDRALVLQRTRRFTEEGQPLPPIELRVRRADGRYARVEFRAFRFEDEGGPAVMGIGRDVTERAEALEAAQRSRALLAAFMEHAPFAMFLKDREGRYIVMNREARRAAGVLDRSIEGLTDADLRPPEIAAAIRAREERVLATGEVATHEGPSPFGAAWSLSITFPIRESNGEISTLGGFDIDLSDRKALEQQLKRSARIEAIGKLTGGVAHDFNNLLTVVIGNLELAAEATRDNRLATGAIANAMGAAERGADLVARLLAFARQQPLAPAVFDLNEQIQGMRAILERSLGETIELRMTLAPDLWPVLADRTQVETAVLNLALNAHDAMPDGGRVLIETRNEQLDEGYAASNEDVVAGDYAMLAFSDNGVGMSTDTLSRAVEPFFTTKEVGRGSGLGLSMVYGFAKQSGGHLKIYSEPGIGTTVRLYLPRALGPAEGQTAAPVADAQLPRGREKILVVEDNDDVRRIVVKQLDSLGYTVAEAPDGPAALEKLRADPGIDLLFTDIVMPKGMSGRVLAEHAQAARPDLKVLFTTGYTADAIVHGGRLDEGVALLSKPFSKAALARKIREILDAKALPP